MKCPSCNQAETKVIDSRLMAEGAQVRRRRECLSCGERVTTYETAEIVMPKIIKQDGSRETFDLKKLRRGLARALEKRPVSEDDLETAVLTIQKKARSGADREITSRQLGELVMESLRGLDQVAYVRFASVYRSFQDISEFRQEIDKLEEDKVSAVSHGC